MTCSQVAISFLDVGIFVKMDMTIGTTLFRKPTAGNTILRANSGQPTSLVKSIPYGQYLRLKRNCSWQKEFQFKANKLKERLIAHGYSKKILKKAYQKANDRDRKGLVLQTARFGSDEKTGTTNYNLF